MAYPLSFEAEEPEWNCFSCFPSLPDLEAEFPRLNHDYGFKLAGGADITTATANSTLSLVYDGTNWLETGRSIT